MHPAATGPIAGPIVITCADGQLGNALAARRGDAALALAHRQLDIASPDAIDKSPRQNDVLRNTITQSRKDWANC